MIKRIIQLLTKSFNKRKLEEAKAYFNEGVKKQNLKDDIGAIEDFNRANKICPKYAIPYYNRAFIYMRLKQYENAIQDFDKALRLEPKNVKSYYYFNAYYNRARAKCCVNDYKGAISDFTNSLKEKPNVISSYHYKGQKLKKDNKKGNNGTSVTWMNYQKLMNYIFDTPDNKNINFHEKSFITEVNSTPSKNTSDANTSSIKFRKEEILKSNFIQKFKIIIISGVGYFNINEDFNEIESIFKVKFTEKRLAENNAKQPYFIHWNDDKTKLVINTYQLSFNISDALLREVAGEILNSKTLKL